jgi:hypothetical protein
VRRFFGTLLAIAGGTVVLWSGASLLATHEYIFGYHPMYPGLAGLAVMTVGLISRQD